MFAQDLPVPVEKVAGIIDLAAVQLRDGSGHEIQPVVLGEIAEELNGGTARLLCIRLKLQLAKGHTNISGRIAKSAWARAA